MDYIESGSPQDDFTKTLNERVEILRSDNGLERKYMTMQQTITEYQRDAKAEGIEIGEARGEARGIFTTLSGLVKDGILTVPQAAERMNISVGEFRQRAEALL